MKILAFRHVPFEGAGRIASVAADRGFQIDYADLYSYTHEARLPDITEYAALIFLGGPMSVNDDLPYLRQEEELIRQALARNQPVMGICLGAQLMARALGAGVYRNCQKEIGWFDLRFTESASRDPLFAGLESETVFHWHGETFDLPPGAEWLVSSDRCRHQAFKAGHLSYGLQFHLEVTPEMIADWCLQDDNCGDVRELDGPIDPRQGEARMADLAEVVFGRWCSLLIGQSEPRR
jgi:GMP synthase (glutamine-hydrolysing)